MGSLEAIVVDAKAEAKAQQFELLERLTKGVLELPVAKRPAAIVEY